jgi:hypothetical protein
MLRRIFLVLLLAVPISVVAENCSDTERSTYLDAVRRDVHDSWRVPYESKAITCTLLIKQNFRGEVEYVGIGKCSEDRTVLLSVVNAGYRASPMPLPDNRACFTRDLIVTLTYKPIGG